MTDLSDTIIAKSDQLNAIDLVSGPITVRITKVSKVSGDQPIAINYDGDGGRPFKPCKSMRRLLVGLWGRDGSKYVGRSLTLYRDPKVRWAGREEGGVRISHASGVTGEFRMPLAESKGKSTVVTVLPLKSEPAPPPFDFDAFERIVGLEVENSTSADDLAAWWKLRETDRLAARDADRTRAGKVATMVTDKISELTPE